MTADVLRDEAVELLRRLIACDTSNPPGDESRAAAILRDVLEPAGVACELVARDDQRGNLVARLHGGDGPTLAFLTHLDVVPAQAETWSLEPFAGILRDGAVWGRGAVDMKCQVAAVTIALSSLAREGVRPPGDVLLFALADEEVGDAGVGAPWLVEERPDLRPDLLVGEGAGERFETPDGPVYLLDCGVKATATATVTVRGTPGDASLPRIGDNAALALARLLRRVDEYRPARRLHPLVESMLADLAPEAEGLDERVEAARAAHPALNLLLDGLLGTVVVPTVVEATGPENVVPADAQATLQCLVLPGTTKDDLEAELRDALGESDYELEVSEPQGGNVTPPDGPLTAAIRAFLAERDPDARLVPTLGYGFSDCDVFREAFGTAAHGFIPFRHGDPLVNLRTKHGADERVLVDDLAFQVECARFLAQEAGRGALREPAAAVGL